MSKASKKAKQIRTYNRGHYVPMQNTNPGDVMNNHQPRVGTKPKSGGCKCDWCKRKKAPLLDKLHNNEFKGSLQNNECD